MKTIRFFCSTVVLCALLLPQASAEKIKISKQDELPRFTYAVPGGSALKLVQSDTEWAPFAARMRSDLEGLLRDYDIQDKTTLRQIHDAIFMLDELEGRDEEARSELTVICPLNEKPAAKLLCGVEDEAFLEARREAKGDLNVLRRTFAHRYAESLNKLPWEVVRDMVRQRKARLETSTETIALSSIAEREAAVQKMGNISGDVAVGLLNTRWLLRVCLPLRDQYVQALRTYIAEHQVTKPDIWTSRSVTLSVDQKLTPVVIGIWDSGVDTRLFPGQWAKTDGKPGIGFDLYGKPLSDLMYPVPPERLKEYPEARKLLKGLMDQQAGLDTPQASELRQQMVALKPEEATPFFERLSLFVNYVHGTHVAGIAVAGNPAARLLAGVITGPYKSIPELLTAEQIRSRAESYIKTTAFFRINGARVVNMSWGTSPKLFERMLEGNGVGQDAGERRRMARELFDIDKQGLLSALKNSPNVLFVCAAGNFDDDAGFDEFVPSSFQLPNLITVGAVDKAGDETPSTSYGSTVAVHANGYEVESFLPGGEKLALSGTSMAAPNVTNLAAKLLALDPALTPSQVIALIKEGATRSQDGRRNLINEKRSVQLLQARAGAKQ